MLKRYQFLLFLLPIGDARHPRAPTATPAA
ncbi:hypothetical protein ACVWYF_003031 [Hymenobacter sp. UYAg731]